MFLLKGMKNPQCLLKASTLCASAEENRELGVIEGVWEGTDPWDSKLERCPVCEEGPGQKLGKEQEQPADDPVGIGTEGLGLPAWLSGSWGGFVTRGTLHLSILSHISAMLPSPWKSFQYFSVTLKVTRKLRELNEMQWFYHQRSKNWSRSQKPFLRFEKRAVKPWALSSAQLNSWHFHSRQGQGHFPASGSRGL